MSTPRGRWSGRTRRLPSRRKSPRKATWAKIGCSDMDVGDWLRRIGFGQYQAAFRDNEIDEQVLPQLTGDDLKELGVASVGHRRKLLTAIAALTAPPAGSDVSSLPPPGESTLK